MLTWLGAAGCLYFPLIIRLFLLYCSVLGIQKSGFPVPVNPPRAICSFLIPAVQEHEPAR